VIFPNTERVAVNTALSPVHTGVADFGDKLSPFPAMVAEFGDYSRQCGQGFSLLGCAKHCNILFLTISKSGHLHTTAFTLDLRNLTGKCRFYARSSRAEICVLVFRELTRRGKGKGADRKEKENMIPPLFG